MLNLNHIQTLKKIKNGKVVCIDKKHKDLDYLYELGYIEITVVDKPGDYFAHPYLTEKGKAKLFEIRMRLFEIWLPVVIANTIAIISLVIAIIALSK